MKHPNLMDPVVRADPYPLYAQLRERDPICLVEPFGGYAISRYDDVVHVLRSPEVFSSGAFRQVFLPPWLHRNPISESLLVSDPPEHTRLRRLITPIFHPRILAVWEQRIRQIVEEQCEHLLARGDADFMSAFASPVPGRVIAEMVGLDPSLCVHFKRWGDDAAAVNPIVRDEKRIREIRASMDEIIQCIKDSIDDHRRRPREDLIDLLLKPTPQGEMLTEDEIINYGATLLIGGFETTAGLMANTLRLLVQRPEDIAMLRAKLELIPNYIEESLRYDCPLHYVFRICLQETELCGMTLSPGAVVIAILASANRDERQFPEPDRFDTDRANKRQVAFGYGIHSCIGAQLARLEARIALEVLTTRVRRVEALTERLNWNQSFTIRQPESLLLRFHAN